MPKAIRKSEEYVSAEDKYNCVKLTLKGKFEGYFPSLHHAEFYVMLRSRYSNYLYEPEEVLIEPWYIEGEF